MFIYLNSVSICIFFSEPSQAALIGNSSDFPGFSARDIRNRNPGASNGVYWIDPDIFGSNSPFQVFAEMSAYGGGWTLGHDKANILPDMDTQGTAINILSVNQQAQIRFVSSGLDAFFTGNYFQVLPSSGWTIVSGNGSLLPNLFNRPWNSIDFNQYSVFVRETNTTPYPEPVPVPGAFVLFASGLLALVRLRKTA